MNKHLFQKSALVAFLVLMAVIVLSTRYELIPGSPKSVVYRLDKWTGEVCLVVEISDARLKIFC